jgi:transcription-repair coupling factor (superfamily II helicase)
MDSLFIARILPQFLERPVFWFEKNKRRILHAHRIEAFWQHNILVVEKDKTERLSEFLRKLHDFGYEKVSLLEHPGEYGYIGGSLTIFPINTKTPYRIEFLGNRIDSVQPLATQTTRSERDDVTKKLLKRTGLNWLQPGDYVVHEDHGIGIFRGIDERNGKAYLALEYAKPQGAKADHDMLYVPEDVAHKVSAYIGFRKPSIHRLGTPVWTNTKRRVKEDMIKFARELLELYAKRQIVHRPPYITDQNMEETLKNSFEFEETADQTTALTEIFQNMEKPEPMDQLLLADVGFGKTEVALRAAFRVVLNKKQVAIICPTTVLADQHSRTFTERLKDFPLTVERLSRLDTTARQKDTLVRLREGNVDIIIGTHRLLSKDVSFKNLGLIIIDEEQRFGVKQKEHLKNYQAGVDVLTLSATPIPRTLHLALSHLRSMSVITTPPKERTAPKTFIMPFTEQLVQEALTTELKRKGQAYFLSNHIGKMPKKIEMLRKLLPNARIEAIHGRMQEREIISIMNHFRNGKIDILVSTTIIENGLDISNANTLIVEDSTRIGLAQAHQLRGRIGRGSVQSYAYFMYAPRHLKDKAKQRLDALFRTQYLGAGQDIALRDLEIRGAGNILGRDQSGRVNQVGLNLYCQMLAETIEQLQQH